VDHKKSLAEREVTFRARPRALLVAVAAAFAPTLAAPAVAHAVGTKATLTVGSGETVEVTATTKLSSLTIRRAAFSPPPTATASALP